MLFHFNLQIQKKILINIINIIRQIPHLVIRKLISVFIIILPILFLESVKCEINEGTDNNLYTQLIEISGFQNPTSTLSSFEKNCINCFNGLQLTWVHEFQCLIFRGFCQVLIKSEHVVTQKF